MLTVSKLLKSGEKAQDVVSVLPIHDIDPPAYRNDPETHDLDNAIEPPDLTAGFSNLKITEAKGGVPTSQECIAHLKVLECFYRLQQAIGSSDGLFGISNRVVQSLDISENDKSELLAKLAEKRWAVYVARAVDRYEAWVQLRYPATKRPTIEDIKYCGPLGELTTRLHISKTDSAANRVSAEPDLTPLHLDDLPPVDVLLIWHALMLNPRLYYEDCIRRGRLVQWSQSFPWELIARVIDSKTFIYSPGTHSEGVTNAAFESLTGRPWDNLYDPRPKKVICPACNTENEARWTVIDAASADLRDKRYQTSAQLEDMLSGGAGYCDKNFKTTCSKCKNTITAEYLRFGKFCRDIADLRDHKYPMPGTILGTTGVPWACGTVVDTTATAVLENVNNIFKELVPTVLGRVYRRDEQKTMSDIRDALEVRLASRTYLSAVRKEHLRNPFRTERAAIRRLMAHYWDNSSELPIDMVGAVIRQCSFTEKMHNIDWLHSPALYSTMSRLVVKYQRFVGLMADKKKLVVPTLDVDLAWHTHQLNPRMYCYWTIAATGQLVDHDDKIVETVLNDAFAQTSKRYQRQYGEPYSECTCWYCEAIRESNTSAASRLFKTSQAQAGEMLHGVVTDPRKSIHVSAHNAVRPSDNDEYSEYAQSQARKLEKAYEAACKRAKDKGRRAPQRDQYYYSDAYGYPVYIPVYSPYFGPLPYTPCLYPSNPGCMAVGAGQAGNCCAGTCGSAVGGGCASASCGGGGSCGGGSSAGCGSSGGGGGGGCGGGGGGGGCGGGGGG